MVATARSSERARFVGLIAALLPCAPLIVHVFGVGGEIATQRRYSTFLVASHQARCGHHSKRLILNVRISRSWHRESARNVAVIMWNRLGACK